MDEDSESACGWTCSVMRESAGPTGRSVGGLERRETREQAVSEPGTRATRLGGCGDA